MAMGFSEMLLFTYLLLLSLLLAIPTLSLAVIASCVSTAGNYTANSIYEDNLNTIFSQVTSQTDFNFGFYNLSTGENPNQVNAIAVCRGDRNQSDCNSCLNDTVSGLKQRCPLSKEVVGWSDFCMLRYANRDIFGEMETSPDGCLINTQGVNDTNQFDFQSALSGLLSNLSSQAASGGFLRKYAAGNSRVGSLQTVLYLMLQCTPDLSQEDCEDCLTKAKANIGSCQGNIGCRIFNPSCFLRFESYLFYQDPVPLPSPPPGKQKARQITGYSNRCKFICHFGANSVLFWRSFPLENDTFSSQDGQWLGLGGGTLGYGYDYSNENFQNEDGTRSQEFPSIQLDILLAATNHFGDGNKLGEGGFGPVYKGTLPDGKEIAVKRLSKTSGQGLLEFKNEVTLIARLQHRNLVRLLGCCLENNEKLLVYEYMPNKSLDVFLFDSSIGVQLDWPKRLSIINSIARAIMYLHEDSRLRIIHRDLKASNVLLDGEMNPKISDFGMARIFGGNQSQANTNRVVGT
ncbi:hypothetical protein COLO4_31707 [Corchorus olitorius]|uniref:non-specific serine/threonine protein kinase n=1 Tax=Corchorus olitorius TaxID=93759 RepID=A0A1R3H3E9_9ROSI|nr:hypothetical protein COLO4_31707 [Corchorus olitorius]